MKIFFTEICMNHAALEEAKNLGKIPVMVIGDKRYTCSSSSRSRQGSN